MVFKCALFVMLIGLCTIVKGHTYHSGGCPIVSAQPNFDMQQFLGAWHAIEKTTTKSGCMVYNMTVAPEPGHYFVVQSSQNFILRKIPIKHKLKYVGKISIPDSSEPGHMSVKFPLNPIGSSKFTIFTTDYENYAGVFTCQNLGLFNRRSVTFLSRTLDLNEAVKTSMRSRLHEFGVNPDDLDIISHENCPQHVLFDINIDSNILEGFSTRFGDDDEDEPLLDPDRVVFSEDGELEGETEWIRI